VRAGPIEGEGWCERRLSEEWTRGEGGFKNSSVGDSSVGGGGRVVEGRREEGGGSLRTLLVRKGGMRKERMVAATGALQRGTVDSFVAKKWKGKGGGTTLRDATRREEKGAPGTRQGRASDGGGWQSG
jgi:hypothetical protein